MVAISGFGFPNETNAALVRAMQRPAPPNNIAPQPQRLPATHLAMAVAIVGMWGSNFVVVHAALRQFPPVTLGVLRFLLSAFPLVFFIRRPKVSWFLLAGYGLLMGVQYSLLYIAMRRDISPGLTSVVLQVQVIFSVLLAALIARERVRQFQVVALGMAAAGLILITIFAGGAGTPLGISLVIGAAACWGVINTFLRQTSGANAFAYVVWGSLFALPPLLVVAWFVDGWNSALIAVQRADAGAWAAVAWQALANNVVGFGAWTWLLARNTAANVTAVALLVPVFGLGAAALVVREPLPFWKLAAAALVVCGLAVNQFWKSRETVPA